MSHVSISKSYTILLGLESYTSTKQHLKHAVSRIEGGVNRVRRPEEEEEAKRKRNSGLGVEMRQSAARDQEIAKEDEKDEEEKELRKNIRRLGVGVGEAGEGRKGSK